MCMTKICNVCVKNLSHSTDMGDVKVQILKNQ